MKIIAFNINGLKTSIDYINKLLSSLDKPDILGLNEIKCSSKTLDKLKLQLSKNVTDNYNIIWNPANISWHGTAMFILKQYDYKILHTILPPTKTDDEETIKGHTQEGRLIAVDINNICYILTYVPNSGVNFKAWLRRLDYRVNSWDTDMFKLLNSMYKEYNGNVIWFGDLNVARTLLDIHKKVRQAGFTDEERTSFENFIEEKKFIDVWRNQNPGIRGYTYKTGWRLDYFLIGDKLYNSCEEIHCEIGKDPDEISDHLPLILNYIEKN